MDYGEYPPREYMTLSLVVELAYPNDPESYAGGSVATGRATLAGQVEGEGSDEEVLQKRTSTSRKILTGQTQLKSRREGNASRESNPKNLPCKFGGSKVAAPPPNYPCVAPVTQPGETYLTDNSQENSRTVNEDNNATKKDKRSKKTEKMKITTWNVRGLINKEIQLITELERFGADLCVVTETKKKMKGSKELGNYLMFYSGVPQNIRAAAGVAILIKKEWKNKINNYNYISERIINIRIKIQRGYMTILGIYAPEEGRKEESTLFYDTLQKHMNSINKNDYIVIAGDFNARIGNQPIETIVGTNGEDTKNENGKTLINFATFNELKITNSFFNHREIHKYTWAARGTKSIIDYVLVNSKLTSLVTDTRAYRGFDVFSDHYIVGTKINIPARWIRKRTDKNKTDKIYFKTHLLQQDSIRKLYCTRLHNYLDQRAVSLNVNEEWEDLKQLMIKVATEVLGKRSRSKKKGIRIWNDEIKTIIEDKKRAYLKYLQTQSVQDRITYKHKCALVKREVRKLNRESWDRYISEIEYDIHGAQNKAYKILKHLNKDEKDTVQINNISEKQWLRYYKELWTSNTQEEKLAEQEFANVDPLEMNELEEILINLKNKKSPGSDGLNIELFKYAPSQIKLRFLFILNICWNTYQIPEEWKKAIIHPIFKKGNRQDCSNYRGISLLNSAYKIYAKIITRRLNKISNNLLSEFQNGFRKGRSCADSILIVQQLIEKRREYNLPTYILFIDFEKAFDKVSRNKLWSIMRNSGYPNHIIETIKSLYFKTTISIDKGTANNLTEYTNQGVKQGCPMSPTLFNIYIDHIIQEWQSKLTTHFKISNTILNTTLFADDQAIFSTSEDDLQRAAHYLELTGKNYNLKISTSKTKTMAFQGKNHIRCKVVINEKSIEQVNNFNYLGFNISYCDKKDINIKIQKFQKLCGTIRRALRQKTRQDTQLKFYKTMAVPMLTYGCENWTVNRSDRRKIEAAEMRFLRPLAGYTLLDHKRNEDIRGELQISSILEKIDSTRKNWLEHLTRMPQERLPKTILEYKPKGKRSRGRPHTRWKETLESGTGH